MNMALITRKPGKVIHHSDQGSQYTSVEFGKRCKEMRVRPSMGSVGDTYDNAMAESFFASLECELIDRRSWKNKTEARLAIFTWIESWYNPTRKHSGLGYLSPNNFERKLNENNQIEINFNPLYRSRPSRFHEKMSVKMGQLQLHSSSFTPSCGYWMNSAIAAKFSVPQWCIFTPLFITSRFNIAIEDTTILDLKTDS
ncbi:Integrase core domain-containing protein [Nitrosomonas oligotropha]|nr:Integrase core domain-containing protein [Nitrosomonas oligotropha]